MLQHPIPSTPRALSGLPVPAARRAEAEQHYRKGVRALQAGQWADAGRHFNRATQITPDDPLFWINLAQTHRKQDDLPRAAAAIRRAIALDPANLLACKFAGTLFGEQGLYHEAIEAYRGLAPGVETDHEYHCSYGEALYRIERYTEAIDQFVLSFTCKPDYLWAHVRLANTLSRLRLHQEAVECFRTALALQPRNAQFLGNLIHQNQYACRWDTLDVDVQQLQTLIRDGAGEFVTPFTLIAIDATPQDQLRAARIAADEIFGSPPRLPADPRGPRAPGERLRIGYLSSDFHHHATALLMAEVLERHDRDRFEVFLYSSGQDDGSAMRRRMMASSEHWLDVSRVSNPDLAQRIRADGIDIAIDLKGFTRDTRMGVLARRPAPIQATWLGFPATCGAEFIDYIIGDPVVTPLSAQPDFSEHIAQLPWTYQPNDRQRPLGDPMPRAACGLPEDAFVFCSFNVNYKILPAVFERWCRLLKAVPGSVLWLFEANPQASANLAREATNQGVDPARIIFAPWMEPVQHLPRIMAADLFLDTLPCNAHTTASDSLWAGVPVITCLGETFAGRVAASLLRAADCEELITSTLDEYEALALALARDPARLAAIRQRLVDKRMTVPLFDSARFARDLEHLYLRMAERHREGLPPAALPAPLEPA